MTSGVAHAGPIDTDPPGTDQPEISIFGPGFGECILVHLGDGNWLVVDSCRKSSGSRPIALDYLERLGYQPDNAIKIIVASHWHDDHVRGISDVVRAAPNAKFYASSAIRRDEFLAMAARQDLASRFTNGVKELANVSRLVDERRAHGGESIGHAAAEQRLWYQPSGAATEVWSLSPSDEDVARGYGHIASLLPPPNTGAARVPALEPNDAAVVLLVVTNCGPVLLGADLEHHPGSRTRGWHAIVDRRKSRPDASVVFKIAHHGSSNADCPEVWEHLITTSAPICLVSPFERGSVRLPQPTDVQRLKGRSHRCFVTSAKMRQASRKDRLTEKMISAATRRYQPEGLELGHVQLRGDDDGDWVIRLSQEARQL